MALSILLEALRVWPGGWGVFVSPGGSGGFFFGVSVGSGVGGGISVSVGSGTGPAGVLVLVATGDWLGCSEVGGGGVADEDEAVGVFAEVPVGVGVFADVSVGVGVFADVPVGVAVDGGSTADNVSRKLDSFSSLLVSSGGIGMVGAASTFGGGSPTFTVIA